MSVTTAKMAPLSAGPQGAGPEQFLHVCAGISVLLTYLWIISLPMKIRANLSPRYSYQLSDEAPGAILALVILNFCDFYQKPKE
ncbi:MAG: hypothetical protein WHT07_02210 [Desulfobaccales bacterium]